MSGRILVTGATGLVGQALVRRLLDDSRDGAGPVVRAAVRAVPAPVPGGVELVAVGDLSANTEWRDALAGVTCVVHVAGHAHVRRTQADGAGSAFRIVNVDATLHLAREAAVFGVRRLVFISSIKVNGEETAPGRPFTAGMVPVNIGGARDPYAQSKRDAETGLRAIAAETGLEVVIIRPPLVYGPGARANFGALVRAVARGFPLPLGSVDNRRSLIGLDNLVDFIVVCTRHPAAVGRTLLVSDGMDLSTPELVRRIAAALGRPAWLLPVPQWILRAGAAMVGQSAASRRLLGSLQIDCSESRQLLGWTPPITVDEGLRRAVEQMRAPSRHRR